MKKFIFIFVINFINFNLKAQSWGGGSSPDLTGPISQMVCFISFANNPWTTAEKNNILSKLDTANNWIIQQAHAYQQQTSFQHQSFDLMDDDLMEFILRNQDERIDRTKISLLVEKKLGFTRKYGLNDFMKDSLSSNNYHILLMIKSKGQSYSLPYRQAMNAKKYFNECCILFHQYASGKSIIPSTMAHEILHLYGAWDFYQTFAQSKSREEKANTLFPNSIMLKTFTRIEDNLVDEVTAWLIGWNTTKKEWYEWFKPSNI